MKIPDWYVLILLALASYRTWRLLAEDDLTDGLRRYITRAGNAHQDDKGRWVDIPKDYRQRLADFIECPWCLGFWITLAWWVAWQMDGFWTTVFAVPMALSALVPLIERVTSSD